MAKRKHPRGPATPTARAGLGYVHPGHVKTGFFYSAMRAFAHEAMVNGTPFNLIGESSGAGALVQSRNSVTKFFLDETDLDWLWWVDTDMGFEPDTLARLIDAADPVDRPMVGALCFGLRKQKDDFALQAFEGQCFPTLYHWEEHDDKVGFRTMVDYPKDALVQVGATGAACFVVHRSLLELIRDRYGDTWFNPISHPKGALFSEDLSFCLRVQTVDKPVYVHTGIHTSHDKGGVFLREKEFEEQELLHKLETGKLKVVPGDAA